MALGSTEAARNQQNSVITIAFWLAAPCFFSVKPQGKGVVVLKLAVQSLVPLVRCGLTIHDLWASTVAWVVPLVSVKKRFTVKPGGDRPINDAERRYGDNSHRLYRVQERWTARCPESGRLE